MPLWDWEENDKIGLNPHKLTYGSNKKANWSCSKGHKWNSSIYQTVRRGRCPICYPTRKTSFREQCFYFYTKKIYPDAISGYKDIFKNGMELDIYIPSIRTGIEYDGGFWHSDKNVPREEKKYTICKENDIRLFRIKEGEFSGFVDSADRVWYVPIPLSH